MPRFLHRSEIVAVALIAATFSLRAAVPLARTEIANLPPPVDLPVTQTTLLQEFKTPARCDPGRPATAWGASLVPIDTKCLETAKETGIVFRGPMHFNRAGPEFMREVAKAQKLKAKIVFVQINSPGGDMNAGIAIGRWLHENKHVRIKIPQWCASACAIAVLGAGPGRITLAPGAQISLHQAFDVETGETLIAKTNQVARGLQGLGLPATAAAGMMRTPPEDGYILRASEREAYGIKQEDAQS